MKDHKHILVTGGAGFIGSHTCVALVEKGYIPVIYDDFRNAKHDVINRIEKITGTKILLEEGDVNDLHRLTAVLKAYPFFGVIHFAADKAVGESVANPLKYFQNNIVGLIQLLSATKNLGIKNIVFSSSCTVYGIPEVIPVDENAPTKQAESPYGFTKLMNEQMLVQFHKAEPHYGIVLLRYFNPIGAHPTGLIGEEPQGIPNNLLPYITQTAAGKREFLTVYGSDYNTPDGTCLRDYIHVMDLAEAHVAALAYLEQNESSFEVFNLGTGSGVSVMEMIHYFEEVSGIQLPYKIGERRAGDVPAIYANPTKAALKLNWKTERTVKEAISDAWNYEQTRVEHAN
jgi:UDP-glucose 4-epimerase